MTTRSLGAAVALGAMVLLATSMSEASARGGFGGGHGGGFGVYGIAQSGYGGVRSGRGYGRGVRLTGNFGPVRAGIGGGQTYYPSGPFGPFSVPYAPAGVALPIEPAPQAAFMPPLHFGPPISGEPGYRAHPVVYHIETEPRRSGRSVRARTTCGTPSPRIVTDHY